MREMKKGRKARVFGLCGSNNIISFGDLLELGFCFFLVVWVLVRMPFHGELSIGFLQVVVFGVLVHLKRLVVVQTHLSLHSPSSSSSSSSWFQEIVNLNQTYLL